MLISWSTPPKYDRFPSERNYIYMGDKLTDLLYKGQNCTAVLRLDRTCICGGNSMLVDFSGIKVVALIGRLRAVK